MTESGELVDLQSLRELPEPVRRYFALVLPENPKLMRQAVIEQTGSIRSNPKSSRWLSFYAEERVKPQSPSFTWDAKIRMGFGITIRVIDQYSHGVGSTQVKLLSLIPIESEENVPELNSAALHRFLAEAVWYPTALLPQARVVWTAIDESSALATLTDHNITVSLEFRFNPAGEIESIFTPDRYRKTSEGYVASKWEGHFLDYQRDSGFRVPTYGEVGWYKEESLELVWKGHIIKTTYQLGS